MSVGLEDMNSKKKINLTQLRRNTRSRADKKSGRKAPRPGDYDIVPAPDACAFDTLTTINDKVIFICILAMMQNVLLQFEDNSQVDLFTDAVKEEVDICHVKIIFNFYLQPRYVINKDQSCQFYGSHR